MEDTSAVDAATMVERLGKSYFGCGYHTLENSSLPTLNLLASTLVMCSACQFPVGGRREMEEGTLVYAQFPYWLGQNQLRWPIDFSFEGQGLKTSRFDSRQHQRADPKLDVTAS